jgi:hypothetical protein
MGVLMNEQLKAKWVEALRSGDYRQGRTFLYHPKDESYCCLGVLCVLHGDRLDKLSYTCTTNITWFDTGFDEKMASYLGDTMNDFEGKSFAEIADFIEENL